MLQNPSYIILSYFILSVLNRYVFTQNFKQKYKNFKINSLLNNDYQLVNRLGYLMGDLKPRFRLIFVIIN